MRCVGRSWLWIGNQWWWVRVVVNWGFGDGGSVMWREVVSGSEKLTESGAIVGHMASTQTRMTARARARAAQRKMLADRKRRDEANMASLTAFFTAAEQIDAAKLAMARALDDIRTREGTLAAAATLTQITSGEARKLVALLGDSDATSER